MNPDPAIAEAVVDGVWRLRSIPGANCYLVELSDGSYVLIDAGVPSAGRPILDALDRLGVTPSALLLTHRHWDHAGGAAGLRDALGLRVVIGSGDVRDGCVRGDRKRPGRSRGKPSAVDEALPMDAESEVLPGVLAIPSPGHTAGSVCFLLPERELMFVGDVALDSGDRMSRPLPFANDDTAMQETSLAAMAERAPRHGAPGHGDPVLDVFGERMRELASMPPAPGGSLLRILLNPRGMLRFMRRMRR